MYSQPFAYYKRFPSREVSVGSIGIGGENPVRIQTMTNTPTLDVQATVNQVIRCVEAGAELVRITVPGVKEAEVLPLIKQKIRQAGFSVPLVADVHYSPEIAEMAARVFEKVRINPGNYADISKSSKKIVFSDEEFEAEKRAIRERLVPLLTLCKQYGTAIRIGINHGSLSWRMVGRYGNTPAGMVASALEFLEICRDEDFHHVILSMKASNPLTMLHANRLLVEKMTDNGMNYPLHLGVTEAGLGEDGRIKSTIGIGTLLSEGIGDTIRVSLTEAPEKEIPVAKAILKYSLPQVNHQCKKHDDTWPCSPFSFERFHSARFGNMGDGQPPIIIATGHGSGIVSAPDMDSLPDDFHDSVRRINGNEDIYSIRNEISQIKSGGKPLVLEFNMDALSEEEMMYQLSIKAGSMLSMGRLDALWMKTDDSIKLKNVLATTFSVLQASRARITKTEFISCPSCGRTKFDIESVTHKVMEATYQFPGLKIAVMGCVVNGPGEMADADYGYVGAGEGKVNLYKGQTLIRVGIDEKTAVSELVSLIRQNA